MEEDRVRLARSHCVLRQTGLGLGRYVQDPIEMKLPKQIVVLGHRTLSLEDLNESTKLVACVRREFLSLLRGNGGVVIEGLRQDTTFKL